MDCSLPCSSVHGILQARILEWVAMPSSGDLPDPGTEPTSLVSPTLQADFSSAVPLGYGFSNVAMKTSEYQAGPPSISTYIFWNCKV